MARPNRGTRLEKNDRGIYEIRWSEGGRSKRVSTGTASFHEASDYLAAHNADLRKVADEARGATVKSVLDSYFVEHVDRKTASPRTALACRVHLDAFFGSMDPLEIQPGMVREYTRRRMAGEAGRQVQSGTVRRELGVLNAALNHAAKERRLRKGDLPPIELPEGAPPRDRWLTDTEVTKLFNTAVAGTRAEVFLHLAYYTAARKNALETLQWSQVDFHTGMIRLAQAGGRETKKRRATVPMHPKLRAILEREKATAATGFVLRHSGNVRRGFTHLVERAGLLDVSPHVMRHTAATHMLRRGTPIWKVAGILGDTVTTVQKTYGHHVPEALMEAVEALL